MSDNNIKAIMDVTMDKLRAMVDADTVFGNPINVEGATIIPVSKVAFGLATGGSDFPSKSDKQLFGGGGGAGVSVTPIGFISVKNGEPRFMPINNEITSIDRAIAAAPTIIDKIKDRKNKDK